MKAKHTADVSLLFGNKRNVKYDKKKNQEEMEIDTSRFFHLFINMPLFRLMS